MSSSSSVHHQRSSVMCPNCGSNTILRYSSTEKNPGRPFFACVGGCGFVKWSDAKPRDSDVVNSQLLQQLEAQQSLIRHYEAQKLKDMEVKHDEEIRKWKSRVEDQEKDDEEKEFDDLDIVKDTFEGVEVSYEDEYIMSEYDKDVADGYDPDVIHYAWDYSTDDCAWDYFEEFPNPHEDERDSDELSSCDDCHWK